MGSIIEAVCPCGYRSEPVYAGGGFLDFTTHLKAPAYCSHCRELRVANYLSGNPRCSKCRKQLVFYNDPSLSIPDDKKHSPPPVFSWTGGGADKRDFILLDTVFLCPKCGQMTMRFVDVGCWD